MVNYTLNISNVGYLKVVKDDDGTISEFVSAEKTAEGREATKVAFKADIKQVASEDKLGKINIVYNFVNDDETPKEAEEKPDPLFFNMILKIASGKEDLNLKFSEEQVGNTWHFNQL
jgi:hypothetical protein